MRTIKTVGRSGQISLGKALAGKGFLMETLPSGDILLKSAVVIPAHEHWLHTPEIKAKVERADKWMQENPPRESNIEGLEEKFVAHHAE